MGRIYGRLRPSRSYHRGGRGGKPENVDPQFCNVPGHLPVRVPDEAEEAQRGDRNLADVRLDRVFRRDRRSLAGRKALALIMGATALAMATRALPRPQRQGVRPRPVRLPRFPKVVGIPVPRPSTTAGTGGPRRGGGARGIFKTRLGPGGFYRRR